MKDIYTVVRNLLRDNQLYRNSDRALIWAILELQGHVKNGQLSREDFLDSIAFESITRARRKVQEDYPELAASKFTKEKRKSIQDEKGTHIYRDKVKFEWVVGEDNIARKVLDK